LFKGNRLGLELARGRAKDSVDPDSRHLSRSAATVAHHLGYTPTMLATASGPSYTDIIQAAASIVSAIAAIALVIVALILRDEVREAKRRPKLDLTFDTASRDRLAIDPAPHSSFWIRIRVRNAPDKYLAHGIQLLLLEAVTSITASTVERREVPIRPFQVTDTHEVRIDLPSNMERRFDLVYMERWGPSSTSKWNGAVLAIQPRSTTGRDVFGEGHHRLVLALTADNADTSYWSLEIEVKSLPTSPAADLSKLLDVASLQRMSDRPTS
jgi:hypothetical protein